MKIIFSACIIIIFFVLLPVLAADNNETIIKKINQKCTQTRSVQSHFEQVYTNTLTKEKLAEKGLLYFLTPHFVKLEYDQPQGKFFLADGLYLYFYDPEENQVIKSDTSNEKTSWLSIINGCTIESHFKILTINEQRTSYFLTLEPKEKKDEITKLELEINKNNYVIHTIIIYEDIGNTNAYRFSDIKTNSKLDENMFIFTQPKQAEIIYMQ